MVNCTGISIKGRTSVGYIIIKYSWRCRFYMQWLLQCKWKLCACTKFPSGSSKTTDHNLYYKSPTGTRITWRLCVNMITGHSDICINPSAQNFCFHSSVAQPFLDCWSQWWLLMIFKVKRHNVSNFSQHLYEKPTSTCHTIIQMNISIYKLHFLYL